MVQSAFSIAPTDENAPSQLCAVLFAVVRSTGSCRCPPSRCWRRRRMVEFPLARPATGPPAIRSRWPPHARALERDIQQRALTRGLIVRGGGFVEMAQVVKLVAIHFLQLPAFGAGPRMRMLGVDAARGVQVAVFL